MQGHVGEPAEAVFTTRRLCMVRHRVGFTGGLFWTGFGFRLGLFGFILVLCVSKPVQIGSLGRKRPQEPISTGFELTKINLKPQKINPKPQVIRNLK